MNSTGKLHLKQGKRKCRKKETCKQLAIDYIRDALMSRQFRQGEHITAAEVAKAIGVSIVPTREAIMELAAQGLLEYRSNTGAVVRTITILEIRQYMQLRFLIEPYAASEAALNGTTAQVEAVGRALEQIKICVEKLRESEDKPDLFCEAAKAMNQADMAFHLAVFEATNNIAVQRFARQLMDCFYLYAISERWSMEDAKPFIRNSEKSLETHSKINQALRERNAKKAADAVRKSLKSSGFFS